MVKPFECNPGNECGSGLLGDDAIDTIESGSMPPRRYTILHRDARLSSDEKVLLIQALQVIDDRRDDGGEG